MGGLLPDIDVMHLESTYLMFASDEQGAAARHSRADTLSSSVFVRRSPRGRAYALPRRFIMWRRGCPPLSDEVVHTHPLGARQDRVSHGSTATARRGARQYSGRESGVGRMIRSPRSGARRAVSPRQGPDHVTRHPPTASAPARQADATSPAERTQTTVNGQRPCSLGSAHDCGRAVRLTPARAPRIPKRLPALGSYQRKDYHRGGEHRMTSPLV